MLFQTLQSAFADHVADGQNTKLGAVYGSQETRFNLSNT